jgi:hypothetical protein
MSKRKEQDDALGNPPEQNQSKFEAEEVKGAARKAVDAQMPNSAVPVPKQKSSHVSENEV